MSLKDYFNNDLNLNSSTPLPHHHGVLNPMDNMIANLVDLSNRDTTMKTTYQQPKRAEANMFSCNYCHRSYHSAQALGGHQNAHKREREATLAALTSFTHCKATQGSKNVLQRHHQAFSSSNIMSSLSSSSSSHHTHGTDDYIRRSPLGIQVRSMVQKPAPYSLSSWVSRCSSLLYSNDKHNHNHTSGCSLAAGGASDVSKCTVVSSCTVVAPPDDGVLELDLSLKL